MNLSVTLLQSSHRNYRVDSGFRILQEDKNLFQELIGWIRACTIVLRHRFTTTLSECSFQHGLGFQT
jgi:hypothetical protein